MSVTSMNRPTPKRRAAGVRPFDKPVKIAGLPQQAGAQ